MQNNVIAFPDNHPYPKRCNTAYDDFAVILIVDDDETRDLIKTCLGYQP